MKKIYIIRSRKNAFGGAENYLLRLSSKLKMLDINHEIIYSNLPKFLPSWFRVVVFNLQLKISKGDKFYFALDRISNPDIYRAGDGVHKVFLKVIDKSKFNLLHSIYLFIEKKCFKNAKRIIVNSKMIEKEIQQSYGIDPSKISLVYNGFDSEYIEFDDSFNRLAKEFSIIRGKKIFLFVGSGYQRKGVMSFMKIISELRDKNIVAFIVGKESNIKRYERLSKEYSIQNIVFFLGPRNDVNDFYNISDFFVFPTHYEPFGNVVLEAMSYGNVVFTTLKNGASEIIDSDFVMKDPFDFTVVKKIKDLMDNPKKIDLIKERNISISQNFSEEKNALETIKVINEVID